MSTAIAAHLSGSAPDRKPPVVRGSEPVWPFPVLFCVPMAALSVHQLPRLPALWLMPTLSLVCLLMAAIGARFQSQAPLQWCVRAACVAAFFCLCSAHVVWQMDRGLRDRLPAALEGENMQIDGRIAGLVRRFEAGRGFDFVIAGCDLPHPWCGQAHRLRLGWYGFAGLQAALKPGDRWRLTVRLKRVHGPVNPGGFDAELRALADNIAARGYVRSATRSEPLKSPNKRLGPALHWRLTDDVDNLRTSVVGRMSAALQPWPDKVRGTLVALVTGAQEAIPAKGWQEFNRTGVSHLMSISGLHVTMFAALATAMLRCLLRLPVFPARCLLHVPAPVLLAVVGGAAAFAYTLFSGWGIPAQRTSLMLSVAGLAVLTGRTSQIGAVMAAAGAVVVVLDPLAPMSAGFWLSFVAVGAIVLVAQGTSPVTERALSAAAQTQWAATVSLVPLGAVWFGTFSLVSPLANAIAIPVISVIVTPLALLGAAVQGFWPWAGDWILQLAAWPAYWLLAALSWASEFPHAVLVVGQPTTWILACGAMGCWVLLSPARSVPRWWGYLLLLPQLSLPVLTISPGEWRMLVLDIGQGNSVLVQTARHALLFDTGPSYTGQSGAGDRIVTPVLQARRISHLDALVVSHRDLDHAGGAASVLGTFDVERLLSSVRADHPLVADSKSFSPCERGMRWKWDGVEFAFLHPGTPTTIGSSSRRKPDQPVRQVPDKKRRERPNARSCVLRIRGPGGSALLTGDIERAQERQLLAAFGAAGLHADVLMAPHHGSNTSSGADFIDAVTPRWVFFQAGYRNRFGHPAEKVRARYRQRDISALRTDRDGALEWKFSHAAQPELIRYRHWRRPYWRLAIP